MEMQVQFVFVPQKQLFEVRESNNAATWCRVAPLVAVAVLQQMLHTTRDSSESVSSWGKTHNWKTMRWTDIKIWTCLFLQIMNSSWEMEKAMKRNERRKVATTTFFFFFYCRGASDLISYSYSVVKEMTPGVGDAKHYTHSDFIKIFVLLVFLLRKCVWYLKEAHSMRESTKATLVH